MKRTGFCLAGLVLAITSMTATGAQDAPGWFDEDHPCHASERVGASAPPPQQARLGFIRARNSLIREHGVSDSDVRTTNEEHRPQDDGSMQVWIAVRIDADPDPCAE